MQLWAKCAKTGAQSKTFISDLNPEETVALKNIIKQFSLNILKEVENYGVKYLQFPITT